MPVSEVIKFNILNLATFAFNLEKGINCTLKNNKKSHPYGRLKILIVSKWMNYSASATTSFTSGIIRFIMPSIPAFKVIIDEGHPLQLPWSIRFTTPSL